jgi:hypothetical protein
MLSPKAANPGHQPILGKIWCGGDHPGGVILAGHQRVGPVDDAGEPTRKRRCQSQSIRRWAHSLLHTLHQWLTKMFLWRAHMLANGRMGHVQFSRGGRAVVQPCHDFKL